MSVISRAELLLQAKNYSGSGDWLDESGNGHDAVASGDPVFNGDHFTLDGSGDWFTITNDAGLNFAAGDDFTLMANVAPLATGVQAAIVSKQVSLGAAVGYSLYTQVNDEYRIIIGDGAVFVLDGIIAVQAGVKAVVTGRRDTAADELEAFVDGVSSGSPTTDTTTATLTNANNLRIGSETDNQSPFTGNIYAVALWREALTDAEIAQAGDELVFGVPTADKIFRSPRYGITRSHTR